MIGDFVRASLFLLSISVVLRADDTKPAPTPPDASKVRETLKKAFEMAKTYEDPSKNRPDAVDTSFARMSYNFANQIDPEERARAFAAIAKAQALAGDAEAAGTTVIKALEFAQEVRDAETRTAILTVIAKVRIAAGDGPLETIRKALESAEQIKPDPDSAFPRFIRDEDDTFEAKKVKALGNIAVVQREAGEIDPARKTLETAADLACGFPKPSKRARALLQLAKQAGPEEAETFWTRALSQAAAAGDLLERASAYEIIIRERIKSGDGPKALDLIAETLQGDFQAFALWNAAEEMSELENGAPKAWLERVATLAEGAQFDRYTKKSKFVIQLAKAQAKAGDGVGAEKTIGSLDRGIGVRESHYDHGRVEMLVLLARTQLRLGNKDGAAESLKLADEMVAPYQGDDGGTSFPLSEIAELFVRVGDMTAARALLGRTQGSTLRIKTLSKFAEYQSEIGDRDSAKATLAEAVAELDKLPNEALWGGDDGPLNADFAPIMSRYAIKEIAVAQVKIGEFDEAMKSMALFNSSANALGLFVSNETYREIATLRSKAGDFLGARQTLDAIATRDIGIADTEKNKALSELALAQARSGDLGEALEWIGKIASPKTKILCLAGFGEGVAERLQVK